LQNVAVVPNTETYARDDRELGDDGLPMAVLSRTAFQQLWIQWVSLPDLAYHMADAPDVVAECVALLNGIQRKEMEAARDAARQIPVYIVNFPDNITAPVIGGSNFQKYCVPMYDEMKAMLPDDTALAVHMDGDLLALRDAIAGAKFDALDSFSPLPDNDTSVAEAIRMWPDKKLMINFPSSVHLADEDEIFRQAEQILDEGGRTGRLWIQISENVPPGLWKKSYPKIVEAVQNFRL